MLRWATMAMLLASSAQADSLKPLPDDEAAVLQAALDHLQQRARPWEYPVVERATTSSSPLVCTTANHDESPRIAAQIAGVSAWSRYADDFAAKGCDGPRRLSEDATTAFNARWDAEDWGGSRVRDEGGALDARREVRFAPTRPWFDPEGTTAFVLFVVVAESAVAPDCRATAQWYEGLELERRGSVWAAVGGSLTGPRADEQPWKARPSDRIEVTAPAGAEVWLEPVAGPPKAFARGLTEIGAMQTLACAGVEPVDGPPGWAPQPPGTLRGTATATGGTAVFDSLSSTASDASWPLLRGWTYAVRTADGPLGEPFVYRGGRLVRP
jgi:hypothetical protein